MQSAAACVLAGVFDEHARVLVHTPPTEMSVRVCGDTAVLVILY